MSKLEWPISWQNVKDKLNEPINYDDIVGAPKSTGIPTVVFAKTDPMDTSSFIDNSDTVDLGASFPFEIDQLTSAASSGNPIVRVTLLEERYVELTPEDSEYNAEYPYRYESRTTLDLALVSSVYDHYDVHAGYTTTRNLLWGLDAYGRVAVIERDSSDNMWRLSFKSLFAS